MTVAESLTVQDLALSPQNLVSPVTVLNHSQSTGQIETTQSYDEAPVFEKPEVEDQELVIPAQVLVPTQNEFASPSPNLLLIGKIIEALSGGTRELGKLIAEADEEQREEVLRLITPEQSTHLNNVAIAIDVDERNPVSFYPPGILIDQHEVDITVDLLRYAISSSNWEMTTELTDILRQGFKREVLKKLSPEEREVVKQLASKTEPKEPNSWENAPIIENLIESTEGLNKSVLPDGSDSESTVPKAEVIVQQPSLLELEKKEHDITEFVGHLIEVRSDNSGTVNFTGNMISYDEKNGFIVIMTEEGERKDVYLFQAFVIG